MSITDTGGAGDGGGADGYDLKPAAVVPIPPRTAVRTLDYRGSPAGESPAVGRDHGLEDRVRNVTAPLVLLGGGVALEFLAVWLTPRGPLGWGPRPTAGWAGMFVGLELLFGTAILLTGALIAARFRGIELGGLGPAAFKLSAVTIASRATASLLDLVLGGVPMGWVIAWVVWFAFYFALLGFVFDLDQEDTWYLVKVVFVISVGLHFVLMAVSRGG